MTADTARYYRLSLNTSRNWIRSLPTLEQQHEEARRTVKMFLLPKEGLTGSVSDADVPDFLVTDNMVVRYLEIDPPWAALVASFQPIVDEIEASYVMAKYFSALSASCVAIERLLNEARIKLHLYHPPIKDVYAKGPTNDWRPNIDALQTWGYLGTGKAKELQELYEDVRGRYLHSGDLAEIRADALRAVTLAYQLMKVFLGFPEGLFEMRNGQIVCTNPQDPRFMAFYESELKDKEQL